MLLHNSSKIRALRRQFSIILNTTTKMSIQKHNYLAILIISLAFFSFPRMLLSDEDKVAVVSKFKGHVEVEHEAVWKSLTNAGNSMNNYSVYNEDTVFTRTSSMADLAFDDNSHLGVKEDTILSVSTRQTNESEELKFTLYGMQMVCKRNR